MLAADFKALPSLKHLTIKSCGIAGKWLSVLLRHAQGLEELHLEDCMQITWLSTEEENSPLSPISAPEASSPGNSYDGLPSSALDGLLRIPSNAISSLKKVSIRNCDVGTSEDAFARFTSLEELAIWDCPELIWSLVRNDESDNQANGRWLLPQSLGKLYINESTETLQLCYPGNLTCLKKLEVGHSPGLRYLQLQTCTALEELTIQGCASLVALEGLRSLRRLKVCEWPGFIQCLERLAGQGYDMRPGLESLEIADYSVLTTSFCIHLTSLQRLELVTGWSKETRLTDQQEISLQLLTSLQDLRFGYSANLTDIPVGLHNLRSLKRLEINSCWRIARLPERGLPPSLEELDVSRCSKELTEQCRVRATRKLKVKIDGRYVN
uniref:Uncharacterized protein n=1 Tax=Arundo donax TaxID=35708 RepID=A0A0A8XP88_ARUDO